MTNLQSGFCKFVFVGILLVAVAFGAAGQASGADTGGGSTPSTGTKVLASPRIAVLISDLHLGFGKIPNPAYPASSPVTTMWHPMEDFRWYEDFDKFLSAVELLSAKKKHPVDLIILGDLLEMWQSPPENRDCVYDDAGAAVKDAKGPFLDLHVKSNLSCNANDAFARAQRVIGAHVDVLQRIGRFASVGANHVTIVPGNHDAALVFDDVQELTLRTIGAAADRVSIAKEGYWRSGDGHVVAEHGHFIEGDVNSYDRFPVQCLNLAEQPTACEGPKDKTYLQRPWGEKFVQDFYDRYEEKFPIVDNLTSEAAGLSLAIHASTGTERRDAIKRGLKFLLLQQSWRQFVSLLGPNGDVKVPAKWDVNAIRSQGDEFFEQSLAVSNPLRDDTRQLRLAGQLDVHLSDIKDDDIIQICDLRMALQSVLPIEEAPSRCLGTPPTLGALAKKLTTTNAGRLADRMDALRVDLKTSLSEQRTVDFDVYVYAHTHSVHGGCSAHTVTDRPVLTTDGKGRWAPLAFNTGAWQRVVTPEGLKKLRSDNPSKSFSALVPEDLPACYSMVIVDPESQGAQPWFWAKMGSYWNFGQSCPEDRGQLPADPCSD